MIGDTIFGVASPPGAAARGIVRLSGPDALVAANEVLDRSVPLDRGVHERQIEVLGYPVECVVLVMPGPRSYTGEDVAELHLPGSPLLLENVQARLRGAARDATPGEFTRRAFEAGRMDLAEVEAVLELIHAAGAEAGRRALDVLRGGLRAGIDQVRALVLDARAVLEAGLDFTEGETGVVEPDEWLPRLADASARLSALHAALPSAATGGELLLVGRANAGKSSLCNALAGKPIVLVSDAAGTTRDVLAVEVLPGVHLLDAAGDLSAPDSRDAAALALRDRLATRGAGAVLVVDLTDPVVPATALPVVAVVLTKLDQRPDDDRPRGLPPLPTFPVSNRTGEGMDALRAFLASRRSSGPVGSGRRIADLLERAGAAIDRARAGGRHRAPEEVLVEELAEALECLDLVHGSSTPEDVLDRIFARFCLGK